MRAFDAQLHGPEWPWRMRGARFGRFGEQLELRDVSSAVAMRGAEAIRAGVAAADNAQALASGEDLVWNLIALTDFVGLRQKLHREVNALELAARYFEVAGLFGAAGQENGVEIL